MQAIDTNVLARYYVEEDEPQAQAQREAARRVIDGGARLYVPKTVLLEFEWVLRGVYEQTAKEVCRALDHLLALANVEIEDRSAVLDAVANLRAGLDFADALHHASSRACSGFLTFDTRRFAGRARRMALTPPVQIPR